MLAELNGAPAPRRATWAADDRGAWRAAAVNRERCFRLLCCLQGDADHICWQAGRARRRSLPAGSALVAPPGHPILAGLSQALMGNVIVDGGTVLLRLRDRARQTHPTAVLTGEQARSVRALAESISLAGDDGLLTDAVALLWRRALAALAEGETIAPQARDHFAAACRIIDEDLAGDCGREAVARALGIHPNHLSRLFRHHAGCGFTRWVNQRRLERARRYLREGLMNCGEAGLAAGFSSHSRFAQVCRQLRGCAPSEL